MSMIKLQIIGNVGKDATVNNVNGKNVINFSVAHTEKFKNAQGAETTKTTWVECAYWTDRTGIAPYLKKGTLVYTEGQPDVRMYTTAAGQPGASLSLRVSSIQLLGSKPTGDNVNQTTYRDYSNNAPANAAPSTSAANEIQEPLDDLPF